jgi:uncharacterized protein with NRDE domain
MCLIAWNWNPNLETSLLLVANRDEFYERPAQGLGWWRDGRILAGQDLQGGGTWLGLGRNGKLATLTNFRQPSMHDPRRPTRGQLVTNFLLSDLDARAFLEQLVPISQRYNPFNLLLFDGKELLGFQSRDNKILCIPAGPGAVSNADFHTPWPKLEKLQSRLAAQIQKGQTEPLHLWPLLQDASPAQDHELPRTGISQSLEKALSSAFIAMPGYGTRACSIVKVSPSRASFWEQNYGENGFQSEASFEFIPTWA